MGVASTVTTSVCLAVFGGFGLWDSMLNEGRLTDRLTDTLAHLRNSSGAEILPGTPSEVQPSEAISTGEGTDEEEEGVEEGAAGAGEFKEESDQDEPATSAEKAPPVAAASLERPQEVPAHGGASPADDSTEESAVAAERDAPPEEPTEVAEAASEDAQEEKLEAPPAAPNAAQQHEPEPRKAAQEEAEAPPAADKAAQQRDTPAGTERGEANPEATPEATVVADAEPRKAPEHAAEGAPGAAADTRLTVEGLLQQLQTSTTMMKYGGFGFLMIGADVLLVAVVFAWRRCRSRPAVGAQLATPDAGEAPEQAVQGARETPPPSSKSKKGKKTSEPATPKLSEQTVEREGGEHVPADADAQLVAQTGGA